MAGGSVRRCGQCAHAQPYSVPREVLEKRIKDARAEYNVPRVKKLLAVLNGEDFFVARPGAVPRHRNAYGSTLCSSPSEYSRRRRKLRPPAPTY